MSKAISTPVHVCLLPDSLVKASHPIHACHIYKAALLYSADVAHTCFRAATRLCRYSALGPEGPKAQAIWSAMASLGAGPAYDRLKDLSASLSVSKTASSAVRVCPALFKGVAVRFGGRSKGAIAR